MVGEPLFRMGEDLIGVKLPVDMEAPRGGSALGGHGWASIIRTEKDNSEIDYIRINIHLKFN